LQTYPRWPITISLSTDHMPALEQVEFYGFRPVRTLLTMRKRVDGQEAPGALDVPGVVF
jgi:hypothetical protein